MTATCHHDTLHLSAPAQPSLLTRAADRLFTMVERHRQRLALQSLSDQALSDIGISRADAVLEAERPFWR